MALYAVLIILLMLPGLFVSGPRVWVSGVMVVLHAFWLSRTVRYGVVRLDGSGLVVHGLGRARFVPLEMVGTFDSTVMLHGVARYRRQVLVVERVDGERVLFPHVNQPAGSERMEDLVDDLNYALSVMRHQRRAN